MTSVDTLIEHVDQLMKAELEKIKAARMDSMRSARERQERVPRYEAAAQHLIELLKPRLDAFLDRFQAVVKAEPVVRERTRAINLDFAARAAKVRLCFEVYPDVYLTHVQLQCILDIVPVLVKYDRVSMLELSVDAVNDDTVVQWFDERIIAFVKAYLALVRQDTVLQEQLSSHLVEDPVVKVRFPKYLAASTVDHDGKTYYFLDDETRREFDRQTAATK